MEGSIFVAGAAVKWLRDGLGLIQDAAETAALAMRVPDSHGVYLVPAFVGLGAPHWKPDARALICGLTLDATRAHVARAALESVAFQTLDLASAMAADGTQHAESIRVDGGMAANDWFCQFLADVVDARVERPSQIETTAMGAAFLAGLATGVWKSRCRCFHLEKWRHIHAGHEPRAADGTGCRMENGVAPCSNHLTRVKRYCSGSRSRDARALPPQFRLDQRDIQRSKRPDRSLAATAAATPAPCPLTAQHIMLRTAACGTLSPPIQRPATIR